MDCACKFSEAGHHFLGLPDTLHPRLLQGLSEGALMVLFSVARHETFAPQKVVTNQGYRAERLYLLTSGQAMQFVITDEGRKVPLIWLRPGQVFGGMTLLASPSRYLTGTEIQQPSCTLVWERRAPRSFVSRHPQLIDNALGIAASSVGMLISRTTNLPSWDAPARVAHLLLSLALGIGRSDKDAIEIPISHANLAAGADVTENAVSRYIQQWKRDGIVANPRGSVLLLHPELLSKVPNRRGQNQH